MIAHLVDHASAFEHPLAVVLVVADLVVGRRALSALVLALAFVVVVRGRRVGDERLMAEVESRDLSLEGVEVLLLRHAHDAAPVTLRRGAREQLDCLGWGGCLGSPWRR